MSYPTNTIDWPIGALVIHDADAKAEHMLMRVIGHNPKSGQIRTRYLFPETARHYHTKVFANPKEELLDPTRFGIGWSETPATPSASEASQPPPAPAPGPVAAVYAKYKHLDRLFDISTDIWRIDIPPGVMARDLWTAIKAQEAP